MQKLIRLSAISAICILSAACGGDSNTKHTQQGAPTTVAVKPLAAPTGEPILEITRPDAEAVRADYPAIDGLATQTYDVFEPFEKKQVEFTGVELWTVLQAAGVPATAESVHLTALDDYAVDLSVADLKAGGVIVATRSGGEPIGLDHGGPIRLVFEKGVASGSNPDQWIWSIATISVR